MVAAPFRSSWEKLDRAERHFQELQGAIRTFLEKVEAEGRLLFSFEQEYRPGCIVYKVADVEPMDVEWGLILGDILHNLRSALDHLAWELVSAGRRPPDTLTSKEQHAVQFPIYGTREAFNAVVKSRLPGVSRQQVAFIRGLQPYKAGKRRVERHPFSILQKYSNDDKHRIIPFTAFRAYDLEVLIDEAHDFIPRRRVVAKVARPEEGAEIMRIYGRKTGADPRVDVRIGSPAEVAIEGRFWLGDVYIGSRDIIQQALYRLAPMVR